MAELEYHLHERRAVPLHTSVFYVGPHSKKNLQPGYLSEETRGRPFFTCVTLKYIFYNLPSATTEYQSISADYHGRTTDNHMAIYCFVKNMAGRTLNNVQQRQCIFKHFDSW